MAFRTMRRFGQQLTDDECVEILEREKRGVLSVIGDGGYPYGIPLDHWYCRENGRIYFHGARVGHKVDAIRAHDKVCYTVRDAGTPHAPDGWDLDFESVVVFGRMREVEDREEALRACRALCRKFTDDEAYIEREIEKASSRVLVLELAPEHMTGKRVNES